MRRDRGWWALICVALGTVLVLLGLYAGAYYAVVQPTVADLGIETAGTTAVYEEIILPFYPEDLWFDGDRVFAPMHAVDRWLRPKTWEGRLIK